MKTLSKVLKGLLVITLFTGTSIVLSTSGVATINQAYASVSYQQVYTYLINNGYMVNTLNTINNSQDWLAYTVKSGVSYRTTVHVTGSSIIGHDDVIV